MNNLIEFLFISNVGELSSIQSSRAVSPIQSLSPDVETNDYSPSVEHRSPSPEKEEPWVTYTRHRTQSDAQYEHTEVQNLAYFNFYFLISI